MGDGGTLARGFCGPVSLRGQMILSLGGKAVPMALGAAIITVGRRGRNDHRHGQESIWTGRLTPDKADGGRARPQDYETERSYLGLGVLGSELAPDVRGGDRRWYAVRD